MQILADFKKKTRATPTMQQLIRLILFICISTQSICAQNLNTSLTACYALNGNGSEPVNLLNATLIGVSATTDRFNNANSAIAFAGTTSSYLQLPNNALIKPSNALSFTGWIKTNSLTAQQILYAGNTCGSHYEGYCVAIQSWGGSYKLLAVKASGNC